MAEVRPFDITECPINPDHTAIKFKDLISVLVTSRRMASYDFIWIGSNMLIQDHVLRMFREQDFTGFDVLPVKVKMRIRKNKTTSSDQEPVVTPVLWEVITTGWAGIASSESGVHLVEKCPGCNRQRYMTYTDPSRLVDEVQWDGSDFFMLWPYPLFKFVTDRVAQFIKDMKLTGIELLPIEKLTWLQWGSGEFSPGRLRDWLPDERARELGEPLGIY